MNTLADKNVNIVVSSRSTERLTYMGSDEIPVMKYLVRSIVPYRGKL